MASPRWMTAQPTDMARPEGVWRSAMALVSNWLRTLAGDAFASRKPAIRSVRPARVQVWATSIASAMVMAVAAAG